MSLTDIMLDEEVIKAIEEFSNLSESKERVKLC